MVEIELNNPDRIESLDVRTLGLFRDPTRVALGASSERRVLFPARCGAVFIEPTAEAMAVLRDYAPAVHDSCTDTTNREMEP